MEVENTEVTETPSAPPPEAPQEQPAEQPQERPTGFDPVEFTPEQKARVDRIYGNMKRYESKWKEQEQANEILIQKFNELSQNQQQIVTHLQTSDYHDAETRLRADRDAAWQKGDMQAYNKANDELGDIRIKKATAAIQQVQPKPQQQPRNLNGQDVVNGALDRGHVNNAEASVVNAWMGETDSNGEFKRPWVNADDPRNLEASRVAEAVLVSPMFANKPMAEKLKEIDRRMGVQNSPGQNVLPAGNLTRTRQNNTIKISPEIERIAIRTKFGGPNAKSDQDHIDAWKRAVSKSQGGKR